MRFTAGDGEDGRNLSFDPGLLCRKTVADLDVEDVLLRRRARACRFFEVLFHLVEVLFEVPQRLVHCGVSLGQEQPAAR